MNELALFAGAGGGILGGTLLGWRTVCAVEINSYCARRLMQRQNEGHLPLFPIWDDVCTFDGFPWRGIVDVVSGGFPCQDISNAGKKVGISGERSGLWKHMARIICEVRPRYVFVENSAQLANRGLDTILWELAILGYNARWGCFSACMLGYPHTRNRMFIVADSSRINVKGRMGSWKTKQGEISKISGRKMQCSWLDADSYFSGMDNGMAHRMDRLKAIGNGQVPSVVKLAWETLTK